MRRDETNLRVIYSTAPAWTSHLVGLMLSHLLRVPLVADFQDPWCGSFWRKIPYRSQLWLDERLENMVVRRASQITCAWDGIRRHLETRYPKRSADIRTILNGFWPDETDEVEPVRLDERRCVLLHAGSFYGPRSPTPLFARCNNCGQSRPTMPTTCWSRWSEGPNTPAVLCGKPLRTTASRTS